MMEYGSEYSILKEENSFWVLSQFLSRYRTRPGSQKTNMRHLNSLGAKSERYILQFFQICPSPVSTYSYG